MDRIHLTQGPFRACSLNVFRALTDDEGKVTALEHKVVVQEIFNQIGPNMKAGPQIMGGITTAYLIPNFSIKGVLRAIVMGLGAAYNGLTIKKGGVVEQNFNTYPILKFNECPEIETFIIDSEAHPDGAGETGLPTVAPALVNAIFELTGKRIRELPLDLSSIV